ncbi:MAG: c-type cytochrome [bacterium]
MRQATQNSARAARGLVLLLLAAAAAAQPPQPTPKSVRITMEALHAAGGTPPGWELTLLPGDAQSGRQVFRQQGCTSCHVVQGADFAAVPDGERGIGPELTGMGAHHPPIYFVESIVNPNAVLIEGPGYIDAGGRSTMPSYPDISVADLQDLVAFLASLTSGGDVACHVPSTTPGAAPVAPVAPLAAAEPAGPLPAPPPATARYFLVQTYDVKPGQLEAFQTWFRGELTPRMRAFPGVDSVETHVDRSRRGPALTTVFGFRDRAAYDKWNNNLAMRELAAKFDDFIGLHGHVVYETPPIYRVGELSLPAR